MSAVKSASPERILLVGVNWLGDALMMTPAVRALRRAFPDAHLECLVPSRVQRVFERNPHVNGVVVYDDRAPILSASFWKTALELRRKKFDCAILFHGSTTKARLMRWAGIPERWGFAGQGREGLLTRAVSEPAPGGHRAQNFIDLLAGLGIQPDGRGLEFVPDPASEQSLAQLLRRNHLGPVRRYAVVHGGGNWELKRWPAANFRKWLGLFLTKYPEAAVLFCGASSEEPLAREIAAGFDSGRVAVLAGQTSLDELALLCRHALFVLTNDSGPIHLAASQGARLVGLFGPTAPAQTGPWTDAPSVILWKDTGCEIPCYFRSCDHRVCMERLAPERVLEACERVMQT